MQIVTCNVSLGGDEKQIISRGLDRPVTYPEALLLAAIHGKESVRDIELLRDEDRDTSEERARLSAIYTEAAVTALFGAEFQPLPAGDVRLVKKAQKKAAMAKALAKATAEVDAEPPAPTDTPADPAGADTQAAE